MHILIITGGFPSKETPLSGIFEFDQAKALRALGHKVVFIALDLRSIRRWRSWRLHRMERDGVIVYQYPIPLGNIPAKWILYWGQRGLLKLYKIIAKEQGAPDIVHAHFTLMAAIASILKQKFALPYIVTEHSSQVNKEKLDARTKLMAPIAYGNADQVISVSSLLANNIKRHFGFASKVIPNMVDASFQVSLATPPLDQPFRFLSVGNLIHRKGFNLLIEAFAKAKIPETVQLDIIGSGECHARLQAQIRDYKLEHRVHLLGFRKREEIADQMQQCRAFVLASRGETFGVVYIEALLSGLPVIATACGGPEDFVNESNGILIPTENVEALKTAIEKIYDHIENYDRKLISASCYQKFAPQTIAKQLIETYKTILNNA